MCKFCGHDKYMCNEYKTITVPIWVSDEDIAKEKKGKK